MSGNQIDLPWDRMDDPKPDPAAPTYCDQCECTHIVPVMIAGRKRMLCGGCARKVQDALVARLHAKRAARKGKPAPGPGLFDGAGERPAELDNAMESELNARRPVE